MEISKENYELYIIDYIDGKLDSEGEKALLAFVDSNPEIKEEFEMIQNHAEIEFDNEIFVPDFSKLKKQNILGENFISDELIIANIEGDLSAKEQILFEKNLSENPEKLKQYKIYSATISKPDLNIVFPNKISLKRGGILINLNTFQKLASIAAVFLLFVFIWLGNTRSETGIQIALKAQSDNSNTSILLPDFVKEIKQVSRNGMNPKPENSEINNSNFEKVNTLANLQSNMIAGRISKIETSDIEFRIEPQKLQYEFNSNTAIVMTNGPADEFKTPGKWLVDKAKKINGVQPILRTDSIIRSTEVASLAINVLNQAPGVLASSKVDDEGHTRGFAIMSRYFSIERSY
jgi:hypothetical protein